MHATGRRWRSVSFSAPRGRSSSHHDECNHAVCAVPYFALWNPDCGEIFSSCMCLAAPASFLTTIVVTFRRGQLMNTASLDQSPIAGSGSAWGRGRVLAALGLAALLGLDGARASDTLIAPVPADGWAVQVELAAEPGSESDPWRARTFALGFTEGSRPRRPIEAVPVRWLDGFQQQASHLGMVIGAAAKRDEDEGIYSFGLTRFVRSVAVHTLGAAATPPRGTASTSSPACRRRTARRARASISSRADREAAPSSAGCPEAIASSRRRPPRCSRARATCASGASSSSGARRCGRVRATSGSA
jgi:hypothetical protein